MARGNQGGPAPRAPRPAGSAAAPPQPIRGRLTSPRTAPRVVRRSAIGRAGPRCVPSDNPRPHNSAARPLRRCQRAAHGGLTGSPRPHRASAPCPPLRSAPHGPPRPRRGAARSLSGGDTHGARGGTRRPVRRRRRGGRREVVGKVKSETCLTRSSKLRRCSLPCQSRRRGMSCGRDTGTGGGRQCPSDPSPGSSPHPGARPRPPGWSPPAAAPGPAAGQPRSPRVSRAEMGWVRRGRANADPAVPRASPVPPGQAPHLVLLQLLHQYLRTEGHTHTHTKDVSLATATQRLRRPVPSSPVPSRRHPPGPAGAPAPRSPGRISCRVRTAGTVRSGSRALRRGGGERVRHG